MSSHYVVFWNDKLRYREEYQITRWTEPDHELGKIPVVKILPIKGEGFLTNFVNDAIPAIINGTSMTVMHYQSGVLKGRYDLDVEGAVLYGEEILPKKVRVELFD